MSIGGKGFFIWKIQNCEGGDVKKIAQLAHQAGFSHVLIKVANGIWKYNYDWENHIDGETALWYSRSRYSSSDFDRTRRQQEVIMALFDRILSLNGIEKAPELYDIYLQNVTTNLTWQDIAPLLPLAAKLSDTSRIQRYYIGPAQVTPWTTPGGAQVLLPNFYAISAVLWQALNGE